MMKVRADQAMHAVRIRPHLSFSMSTKGPPPRLTTLEPACLMENRMATVKLL